MTTLDTLVTGSLHRLDDEEETFYSRGEMAIYVKDGYDQLCRRTKCIFDIGFIENLPAVGNYSSDEEFEMAKQIPGLILTGKRTFTREVDRDLAPAGSVGPAGVSTHAQLALLDMIPGGVSKPNPVGQLPRDLVEIERVSHDQVTLFPEFSYGMSREVDARYESQGGSPNWFTVDKDGLFTLRRYPTGDGAAVYDDVVGCFGVEVSDTSYTGDVIGSWGAMVYDPEQFPSEGPWGAPTRTHPDVNNTKVEFIRLGRDLDSYPAETPRGYDKYIEFWACSRALKRDGPGQDVKLSQHYANRFEVGVSRLINQLRDVQPEYTGRIGHGSQGRIDPLQVSLPYNYGRVRRRGRY